MFCLFYQGSCTDSNRNCPRLIRFCADSRRRTFMERNCRKTCNICSNTSEGKTIFWKRYGHHGTENICCDFPCDFFPLSDVKQRISHKLSRCKIVNPLATEAINKISTFRAKAPRLELVAEEEETSKRRNLVYRLGS